jgi:hypothetical protein
MLMCETNQSEFTRHRRVETLTPLDIMQWIEKSWFPCWSVLRKYRVSPEILLDGCRIAPIKLQDQVVTGGETLSQLWWGRVNRVRP